MLPLLGFWLGGGLPHAQAADLRLPPSEDPAVWQEAIMVSGLATVAGQARIESDGGWVLVVTRPDGSTIRRRIDPPHSSDAREATAILAASLLRPVSTITLPTVLPPPPPAPTPAPKPRTPASTPTHAPVPRPPEPVPLPPDPVIEPSPSPPGHPPQLAVSGGIHLRNTSDQGLAVGTEGSGTLQTRKPWVYQFGASLSWTPRPDALHPERDLTATSGWIAGGIHTRPPFPALTVSIGAMHRTYRFEGTPVATVAIPQLGIGTIWDPPWPVGTRGGLRFAARLERDLRRTVLSDQAGVEGPVSPLGFTVGISGRYGPALGTWDTAPVLSGLRQKKTPSP